MTNLWVTGRVYGEMWDLQGIFDSEDKAKEACRDKKYFFAPVELNVKLPHKSVAWPGLKFPLQKDI